MSVPPEPGEKNQLHFPPFSLDVFTKKYVVSGEAVMETREGELRKRQGATWQGQVVAFGPLPLYRY